jgi:hypothetical protein
MISFLRGLFMLDDLPNPRLAVYIFLEMIALGFALEAVAALMRGDDWWKWIGALIMGVVFMVLGVRSARIVDRCALYLNTRIIWMVAFVVFSLYSLYFLQRLVAPDLIMNLRQRSQGTMGYAVAGVIGATLFCLAWWLSGAIPKASIPAVDNRTPPQSSDRVSLLNSINDFISKKDELELRDTFDFPSVVRDAILEAKIQLTTAAATQAERDTVARDMVDGQNVFYFRYVHRDGDNITPLHGKSGILHLTPKAVKARKQLAIFYSSALTPVDVSDALKDLEKAIADNQEILMDTINESYAAKPSTLSNALACPKEDCMAINNLFYSRFIQLQPKATAITSAMRKYIESRQF